MTPYERIFGAGPRGLLASLALLAGAWGLESSLGLSEFTSSSLLRRIVLSGTALIALALIAWSARALPPKARGRELITTGAFRYFRHPLYAAFLSCFNFGLAFYLNSWIYIMWAVVVHILWHWNVRSEERLMMGLFPKRYEAYCKVTGRFVPRVWGSSPDKGTRLQR